MGFQEYISDMVWRGGGGVSWSKKNAAASSVTLSPAHLKAQEGKRGQNSLVKSGVIKYNHYQIVFSKSTYMYVVNG